MFAFIAINVFHDRYPKCGSKMTQMNEKSKEIRKKQVKMCGHLYKQSETFRSVPVQAKN